MGRVRLPPNATCCDCGAAFRSYGCIRCPECRAGKQGNPPGEKRRWAVCPKCGRPKTYAARMCARCWRINRGNPA